MFLKKRKALTLESLQFIEDTFPRQEDREIATLLYPLLRKLAFFEDWVLRMIVGSILVMCTFTLLQWLHVFTIPETWAMRILYTLSLFGIWTPLTTLAIGLLRRRIINKARKVHQNQLLTCGIALHMGCANPTLLAAAARINAALYPSGPADPSPTHPRRIFH
jgi:hypothetical protein